VHSVEHAVVTTGVWRLGSELGHTPGHSAILFADRWVLFAGDAMCTLNAVTFSRGPQLMPSGMNVSDAEAETSLARLAETGADTVLVGHG